MSYISHKPTTKSAFSFLRQQGSKKITKFLGHVICSSLRSGNEFTPVPFTFIQDHFDGKSSETYKEIEESGLFKIQEHSFFDNECREFAADSSIIDAFLSYDDNLNEQIVDSNTGKLYKPITSKIDENKHPQPKLLLSAVESLIPQDVNYEEVLAIYEEIKHQKTSNRHNISHIRSMGQTGSYVSSYKIARTGRLFENGGAQQLEAKYRGRILTGKNLTNHNYDLVSAQAACLLHCFNADNIKCEWLETYINDDCFRKTIQNCFNDKGMFKILFYSTLFGGEIFPKMSQMQFKDAGKALRSIYPNHTEDQFDACLQAFCKSIKPLRSSLDQWLEIIVSEKWLSDHKAKTTIYGKYITNMADKKLELTQFNGCENQMKRKLAAHILQGMEVRIISTMVAAAPSYGVGVGVLCHDGFITNSPLHPKLIEIARESSGIHNINITEKELSE